MNRQATERTSRFVLEVSGLNYGIKRRTLFDNLHMTVAPGETVAITGASGSGKSTLLACILGLTKPDGGRIVVAGQDLTRLRHAQLAKLRNQKIGVVFQFGELLPELSPVDNVALAPMLSRENSADAYRKARTLLNELGVPDACTTAELSGGEHQRTAVARALINQPDLVLADEPTGALDPEASERTASLLFDLPKKRACGLLLVTHDLAVADRADRVLHLHDGALTARNRPQQEGTP